MRSEKTRRVLERMITHIDRTREYADGETFESFSNHRMLQEACIFNMLQLGELSKVGLEESFAKAHPEIAWNQMYGMRNRIVHDYEGVNIRLVWEIIRDDIPELKRTITELL